MKTRSQNDEIPAEEPAAPHQGDGIAEPIKDNYTSSVPAGGPSVVPESGGTPGSRVVDPWK